MSTIKKIWIYFKQYLKCLFRLHREYREAGATLIEIIIWVLIVLILASTVTVVAISVFAPSQEAAAKMQIRSFQSALESYYMTCRQYPSEDQGLEALVSKPSINPPESWNGPYLMTKTIPKDPWGSEYEYKRDVEGFPYGIISYGADGKQGGEGSNKDIVSWEVWD